ERVAEAPALRHERQFGWLDDPESDELAGGELRTDRDLRNADRSTGRNAGAWSRPRSRSARSTRGAAGRDGASSRGHGGGGPGGRAELILGRGSGGPDGPEGRLVLGRCVVRGRAGRSTRGKAHHEAD